MSERTDAEFLGDIQEAAGRIKAYTSDITYAGFLTDTRTQDAVIRNLEIIGEATKSLSSNLRAQYADLPWKSMSRVRDRLIHHYFGVNLDVVWQIVSVELPAVASWIENILSNMASESGRAGAHDAGDARSS